MFVGGGTPTLLGAGGCGCSQAFDTLGLARDAEVTTEANPESVDGEMLRALRLGGFTRVSLGMQSAAPHVLRTLGRVHTPGRAVAAAVQAREAGFQHVSLDLIYGTPGETEADWEATSKLPIDGRGPRLGLRSHSQAGDGACRVDPARRNASPG